MQVPGHFIVPRVFCGLMRSKAKHTDNFSNLLESPTFICQSTADVAVVSQMIRGGGGGGGQA